MLALQIFAGDGGHRGEVLSIDFHLRGDVFASSGMDNCIKLWSLDVVKDTVDGVVPSTNVVLTQT